MHSAAQTVLTWLGRLFLLTVPLVIYAGLYHPAAIQFLNPVACRDGMSLARQGHDPNQPWDNRAVCESEAAVIDATSRLFGIAGVSFALAVGAYTTRGRIRPKQLSAPHLPQHV